MAKLVKANLVAADWNSNPYHGFITDSVVSFVVRKGNPKGIKDWPDLIKPGVKVLTPNPFSSGSARWNILGAYGAQIKAGKTDAEATAYLTSLLKNVPVQDASGAKALADFVGGAGDVLISYENEAIYAKAKNQPVDYVIPSDTLLIENPIAVTSTTKHPAEAKAFVDFLYSTAGQQIFADIGYRPVVTSVKSSEERVPGAERAVHHQRRSAAGPPRPRSSSTRPTARSPRSRNHSVSLPPSSSLALDPSVPTVARPPGVRSPSWWRGRGRRVDRRDVDWLGSGHAVPEFPGAHPAGCGDLEVAEQRLVGGVAPGHLAAGRGRAEADADDFGRRRALQLGDGHGHRVGAGARRLPGQGRRRVADRFAVRVADDRGRRRAAEFVRAAEPGAHQHCLHPYGGDGRACSL